LIARALIVCLLLMPLSGCNSVFFYPLKPYVRTPDQIGLEYESVTFESADGVRLSGWYLPAHTAACGTILFLHGNAENISTHIGSVYWLPARGFNVFMPDYRGYGASHGAPSLPGLQADIDAALRYLLARPGLDANRIVVFGQSLGGAAAVYYVAHTPQRAHVKALVIDSAFSSHRDIAREKLASFWGTWLFQYPLSWTVTDDYSPLAAIDQIAPLPLLLVHGERDDIIPSEHSKRLFAAAAEPKQLWLVPDVGHIQAFQKRDMRERFAAYLQEHLCPGK